MQCTDSSRVRVSLLHQERAGAECQQLPFLWLCAQIAHMPDIVALCKRAVAKGVNVQRAIVDQQRLFKDLLICIDEAQVRRLAWRACGAHLRDC